jgi:FtsZ-interacting cell division protein ZipA
MSALLISEQWISLLIQYIVYGVIIIVGLIVLLLLRKRDKRPNMVIAKQKTEKLQKEIDTLLKQTGKEELLFPVKYTQLKNRIGDLVVLTEKEVTEKRNVAYADVLEGYKALQNMLGEEENWSRKRFHKELSTIQAKLNEVYNLLVQILQET